VGTDRGAVEERHAKLDATRLRHPEQPFHTPSWDQRMKVWAAIHQGPNSSSRARHFAPFVCAR
jgi:hypothetical protein